jgi:hypothetical protein
MQNPESYIGHQTGFCLDLQDRENVLEASEVKTGPLLTLYQHEKSVWEEIENGQTVHKGIAKLLYRLQTCKARERLNKTENASSPKSLPTSNNLL